MSRRFLVVSLLYLFSAALQADVGYRNSLGLDTSLGDYDFSLGSVQVMDRPGGSLETYSFGLSASRSFAGGQRLLADASSYRRRSADSWSAYARYRLGWGYAWSTAELNWSGLVRLEHRDISGDQHQRAEVSLQASRSHLVWRTYVSGQMRYHLGDNYLMMRRVNLGASRPLGERWGVGTYLRYQQSKSGGNWQNPDLVLGTSLDYQF